MGYACPVCGDPQADAEHLANHLAFTAMLGNDRHEAWLDERAADWETAGPEELAERVVEHADEIEFPRVFENTVESGTAGVESGTAGVESGSVSDRSSVDGVASNPGRAPGESDPQTRRILAEARELTRRMYDELEDEADPESDQGDPGDPGDQGDQGDPGDQGDQGDPGDPGDSGDSGDQDDPESHPGDPGESDVGTESADSDR